MKAAAVAVVCSAGLLVGCGNAEDASAPQPADGNSNLAASTAAATNPPSSAAGTPGKSTSPSARGAVVKTEDSDFGEILFDGTGQAIYLFDKEKSATPQCYGACAEAWPPVLTKGAPAAAGATKTAALGTTRRRDGTVQVTYAGHPLYTYAHEGKHQVLCHNVAEYGGVWLAVTRNGIAAPV